MRIETRMTRNPVTIGPHDLLSKAQELMETGGFRRLPVVENGKLVEILTNRDMKGHLGVASTQVVAVMTRAPLTVSPKDSAEHTARIMVDQKIGGVPVVDKGNLVGIITTTDVLNAFLDAAADLAKIARE